MRIDIKELERVFGDLPILMKALSKTREKFCFH